MCVKWTNTRTGADTTQSLGLVLEKSIKKAYNQHYWKGTTLSVCSRFPWLLSLISKGFYESWVLVLHECHLADVPMVSIICHIEAQLSLCSKVEVVRTRTYIHSNEWAQTQNKDAGISEPWCFGNESEPLFFLLERLCNGYLVEDLGVASGRFPKFAF